MTTLRSLTDAATARLRAVGVPDPRLDARVLIRHALGLRREAFVIEPERPVSEDEASSVDSLLARRERREPVSRILGEREFWSLPFKLSPDTLDPRPDSETLVAAVLERVDRTAPLRLLDLGTGSGCLLLALLHDLPNAWGLGVDLASGAASTAAANARALGLEGRAAFAVGRWTDALQGRFDVVLSNPPYISGDVVPTLEPEVRSFDPMLALVAGGEGLDAYRELAPRMPLVVNPEGLVAFEVGQGQASDVAGLLADVRFTGIETIPDLAGIGRVVVGRRPRN